METPPGLCNKTLANYDLHQQMGLTVIANPKVIFKIDAGDEPIVIGRIEDTERLSNN